MITKIDLSSKTIVFPVEQNEIYSMNKIILPLVLFLMHHYEFDISQCPALTISDFKNIQFDDSNQD